MQPKHYALYKWISLGLIAVWWPFHLFAKGVPALASSATAFSETILILAVVAFAIGHWLENQHFANPANERPATSPFTKAFVWSYILIITIRCLPSAPPEIKPDPNRPEAPTKRQPIGTEHLLLMTDEVKPALDMWLWTSGVWQSWEMFAPNPSSWEGYVTAKIFYKDGQKKDYTFPRMYELPIGIKYFKERYRKYLERGRVNYASPAFGLRVAQKNYTDPANPPVKVELYVHEFTVPPTIPFSTYLSNLWRDVSSGKASFNSFFPENPEMPDYKTTMYYPYVVDQELLKRFTGLG